MATKNQLNDATFFLVAVPKGSGETYPPPANGVFTAWVSAADVVTVRFTNTNLVTSLNPASATFNVRVWQ